MRTNAEELSDALDVEFYLQNEGIAYKLAHGSSGLQANLKTCPACGDHRWRTYLNVETGRGNCFVCSATFNKLSFAHAHFGTGKWRDTFRHVETVLKDQGWRPKVQVQVAVDETPVKLPESFALPTPHGQNLTYLEERQVSGELAKYFHLRFCIAGWWNFTRADGTQGGQRFDNRVIIPVYDLEGRLVTFQGRDITGESDRKYLFPAGLSGTGRFLYNGHNVRRAKRVVMGEGAFDVIALKRALDEESDLRDVVPIGSFGKHLSSGSTTGADQLGAFLELKHEALRQVTIMWDGEVKALEAALDAAKLLNGAGLEVKVACLPAGKDPNEVAPDIVRQAFYDARSYSSRLHVEWKLRNPYARKNPSALT